MSDHASAARRLWQEVFPAVDTKGLAEIVAADCVDHSARPGEAQGIEGVRNTMHFLDAAFSDQRFDVQQTVEQGDTVVVRFVHHGIHTGQLMGLRPTNRQFANEHIHILRFKDDKAIEHWGLHDHLSLMHQLNAPAGPR